MKPVYLFLLMAAGSIGTVQAQNGVKKKVAPATSGAGSAVAGKAVYTKYCLSCHMADGGGVQNLNPPLIKTSYVLGDKNKLAKIVLNGFSERVEIEGEMYNNTMPSFNYLNDKQIADVLTYVRNDFGNKASAVVVAEVTKARKEK
ncbi:c-type cytochrome [Mucilaginibacter daejeonensis]|uniref:c-type cytochrome n=1 Tax=Mucilaginibacter daejeonensis TaxID=398049 RepID=UPI001D173342|nr:cytochrome c [Mucilaginibacter daejeonensis]UEG55220.1 c-type cytochrome [Mucilaginibacter daejeonensis]